MIPRPRPPKIGNFPLRFPSVEAKEQAEQAAARMGYRVFTQFILDAIAYYIQAHPSPGWDQDTEEHPSVRTLD